MAPARPLLLALFSLLGVGSFARAADPPAGLPLYDVDIHLDPAKRLAKVHQEITFTNRTSRPVSEIVFNVHGRYTVEQVGFVAKMAEILRMSPKESMYFDGPPLEVTQVAAVEGPSGPV